MKAYPIMYKHPTTGLIVEHEGMELRDWFAGLAMEALVSVDSIDLSEELFAKRAYKQADAMIKARENKDE